MKSTKFNIKTFLFLKSVFLISMPSFAFHDQIGVGIATGLQSNAQSAFYVQVQGTRLHQIDSFFVPIQIGYGTRLAHFNSSEVLNAAYNSLSMNADFHLNFEFASDWQAGFNIDVIGATLIGSTEQRFNLLLGGSRDLGFLNSEFFVAKMIDQSLLLKLNFHHLAIEQTKRASIKQQIFTNMIGLSFQKRF